MVRFASHTYKMESICNSKEENIKTQWYCKTYIIAYKRNKNNLTSPETVHSAGIWLMPPPGSVNNR